MALTKFASNSKTSKLISTNGSIKTLVTPAIDYMDRSSAHRPIVVCTFTNQGANFAPVYKETPYDVSITYTKIGTGVYEYNIKMLEAFDVKWMLPQVTITNAPSGQWNKRCIAVENWGNYNGYWRIRVITSDGGSGKRIECNFVVVMLGRQGE